MPVGTSEWRAGIAGHKVLTVSKARYAIPVFEIISCILSYFAYLYFIILLSVETLPFSLLISFVWSHICTITPCLISCPVTEIPDIRYILAKVNAQATLRLCVVMSLFLELVKCCNHIILHKNVYAKKISMVLQHVLFALLIGTGLQMLQLGQRYPIHILLLLSGDVHQNPGPQINKCLKFFHWNLNSLCVRDRIKIPLIEAYDALHKFDIIAVSESMLDKSIKNDEVYIEGFSKDVFRSDHPSNTKTGGVCLYAREFTNKST